MTINPAQRFHSEEDLDLQNLSSEEFHRLSAQSLRAAQTNNAADQHVYHHVCLAVEPGYEYLLPAIRSGML